MSDEGSWVHCGYHLTTSIVAPALLSLPFAFATLGWAAGVACLTVGALVTFYSYNLLSLVLEHHAALGNRHLRFRDMADDVLGELLAGHHRRRRTPVTSLTYGWKSTRCPLLVDILI